MPAEISTAVAFWASVAICLRLLLFRRRGCRHRRFVSAMAWLLINFFAAVALHLAVGYLLHEANAPWPLALVLLAAAVPVFVAKGNVANLTRPQLWF